MKDGWEIKRLGEVCDILNGGTPDTTVKEYWGGANLWITPKDMGKLKSIYVDDTERRVTDAGLKNSSAKILPPNSIILSSRAPIGHLAVNTEPISTNQGCKGLIPNMELDFLFLFYFLKNSVDHLNELGSGTTFKELSSGKLADVKIPMPSLPEQQHTVSLLNKAFVEIDQAKENTQRNLQNAKELFQSELNSLFINKPKGWTEKKLGEVLERTETVNPLNKPDKDFIYIDVSSVNKETLLIEETALIKGKDAPSRARKAIRTNDVIFATVRPTLKRIAIIPDEYNEQVCSTGYFVLRASEIIHFKLLFYYLQTFYFQDKMEKLQKGASYPAVTDGEVKEQLISFPIDKNEQNSIVKHLDDLSLETKKLEEKYQKKLNNLEALKKSILQKAFCGELTNNIEIVV